MFSSDTMRMTSQLLNYEHTRLRLTENKQKWSKLVIGTWKTENNDMGTMKLEQCRNLWTCMKEVLVDTNGMSYTKKKTMDDWLWVYDARSKGIVPFLFSSPEPEPMVNRNLQKWSESPKLPLQGSKVVKTSSEFSQMTNFDASLSDRTCC